MDQVSQNSPDIFQVAFIKARWHSDIVDQCYGACKNQIERQQDVSCQIDTFNVPGAFEIPLLAQDLAKSGQYNAIIASAFVVNGGIYRHDFVSSAVIDGMMRVQLDTGVPIFSAVLTPHNFHGTTDHKQFFFDHFKEKGREVAEACLTMMEMRKIAEVAA